MSSQSYYFVGAVLTVIIFVIGYALRNREAITRVETHHTALCDEHIRRFDGLEDKMDGALERLDALESKLDTASGEMNVYFKVIDKYLSDTIHSPVHRERDLLMDKLSLGTLTEAEASRLSQLLSAMMKEETDHSKKLAGAFASARVESLLWKMRRERAT